jgi:predicted RNA polymerase sigma factor
VYHLQAAIAACHCAAKDYESTDWRQILSLYERLVEIDSSPVVALNHAIVVANLRGPQAGIDAIAAIPNLKALKAYYLLYAALGEFQARLGRSQAAAANFRTAQQLAGIKSEQRFLANRLEACEAQA